MCAIRTSGWCPKGQRRSLPLSTTDQEQLRTDCWMPPALPVRAGGGGAGLALEIFIGLVGRSPTVLLLCDGTSHDVDALAAAQRDRYRTHAATPDPSPRIPARTGMQGRPAATARDALLAKSRSLRYYWNLTRTSTSTPDRAKAITGHYANQPNSEPCSTGQRLIGQRLTLSVAACRPANDAQHCRKALQTGLLKRNAPKKPIKPPWTAPRFVDTF
jgi:hypothetical protein